MKAPWRSRRAELRLALLLGAVLVAAAACGGGGTQDRGGEAPDGRGEGAQVSAGDPENGRRLYAMTCATCHGQTGEGVPGLGKNLTTSEFVRSRSDEEMVAFLREGRRANHPDNTTGIDMPPRGGNPSLTDQDLADITAYVRQLQQ